VVGDAGGPGRPPAGLKSTVQLGLRENWPQFALLVVVNVFVGGMVGLERTTTSLIGARVFHLSGYLAVFSFIIAFGVTKALPFLLAWAPAWGWIVVAWPLTAGLASATLLGIGTAMAQPAVIAGGAITLASGLLAARWITGGSPPPVAAQAQAQAQAQLGEAQPARARQASRR
jgi:hypothetical protein